MLDSGLHDGDICPSCGWSKQGEDSGRCRFNCRTAKENWMDGYVAALMHETSFSGGLYKLAEVAYDEWKRRQASTEIS